MLLNEGRAHLFGIVEVELIVSNETRNGVSAVVDLAEESKERDKVEELAVFLVVVPRNYRHSLFWLEHVG